MKYSILILIFVIRHSISFSASEKESGYCGSKPSGAVEMSTVETPKENTSYYSCNADITRRFGEEWCVFNIYHSTFKSIHSSTENGGALYITNKNKGAKGNILIYESTFNDCEAKNGGAIYIKTSQYVRFYNITKCIFNNNRALKTNSARTTKASEETTNVEGFGGAIYFEAAYGNIEECEFNNNKANNGNDFLYNDNAQKKHDKNEVKINNNKFIRTEEETTKSSMIYIHIEANSKFSFTNNEITSTQNSNNAALFENADGSTEGGTWTFSSNCISSSDIKIYESTDLGKIIPSDSFTACSSNPTNPTNPTTKPTEIIQPSVSISPPSIITPTQEPQPSGYCGSKPSGAVEMSTVETPKENTFYYSCNADITRRFGEEWCVFNIYHSTFKSIHSSTENGGALYITNKNKGAKGNILIYESTFNDCEAKNGGAIYIKTSQYVRFYNITKCIFNNNRALKTNSARTTKASEETTNVEGFGGAIYFEAAYGNIEECEFNNNKANNGNDFLYNDNAQKKHDKNEVKINNNKFIRTEEETTKSSMIYIHIEANSKFSFTNNEITSTQNSNNAALFENADGSTEGGTWTFSSNCISSSDIKIYESTDLGKIIPSDSFTACSSNPTNPTNPTTKPTEIIQPSVSISPPSIITPTQEPQPSGYCGSKPSGAVEMSTVETPKENTFYYSCNADITRRFGEEWCVFNIYHSTFKSIHSSTENGGALYITNKNKGAKGNILIYESTFNDCEAKNGGAIYIKTSQYVRFYNITKCIFNNNRALKTNSARTTKASEETTNVEGFGGAIYFEAAYGNIEECEFNNNKANNGNDFLYNDNAQKKHDKNEVKINNNKFIRTEEETTKSSMIYIHIEANSKFSFTNNEITSTQNSNNAALFENADGSTEGGTWTFSSNCISSSDIKIYESTDLGKIIPSDSFTACSSNPTNPTNPTTKPTEIIQPSVSISPPSIITPTQEPQPSGYCGSKPSGAVEMSTVETPKENTFYYSCNADITRRFGEEWCVFNIYHSTFKSIHSSTENGGALYITNKNKGAKGNILIYESTFNDCEAKNGGAIYIKTSQYVRFYNITKCIFNNNRALKTNSARTTKASEETTNVEGFGGAIYFEAAYGNIEECEFNNNKANNGNDFLYNDNAQKKHDKNEVKINNNKFIRTEEETTKSSMIYIHIEANSKFSFTNNEITSTQNSNNAALFENADGSTEGGTWTFSSNCISSSDIKIYESTDLGKIIPSDSFIAYSSNPTNPTTKPTEIIQPSVSISPTTKLTEPPQISTSKDLSIPTTNSELSQNIPFDPTSNTNQINDPDSESRSSSNKSKKTPLIIGVVIGVFAAVVIIIIIVIFVIRHKNNENKTEKSFGQNQNAYNKNENSMETESMQEIINPMYDNDNAKDPFLVDNNENENNHV
ncbi:hypothetical protein M9Y10_004148 [Tritrichomonas musculus]|uniref:Polymorphic outer membrane protein n=1 Tax=Tritrichomonas musculus TaxID=1915356 RepID=A0ABR2JRP2_9EUKA